MFNRTADEGKEIALPDYKDDVEDDDRMALLTRLPCLHTARHTALSTSLRWLGAQDDCDLFRLQLVQRLQRNAAMKRPTHVQNLRSAA